jgi:hypothetical protein
MRLSDLHRRILAQDKEFKFLLDDYPNAAAAYSLRKLRSDYTGNCIEVRRSSDNALQNIGFVDNVLDTASLLLFVGAGNGFVRTWYDQSGNTRNAVQTTNNNQPRIVNGGVLEIKNSKPSINWYQNGNILSIAHNNVFNWTASSQITNIIVVSGAKLNQAPRFIDKQGGNNFFAVEQTGFQTQGSGTRSFVGSIDVLTGDYFINHSYLNGNISGFIYANNQLSATATTLTGLTNVNSNALLIGNTSVGDRTLIGFFGEVIIYPTDQSANRIGIQKNINDYYNIF